MPLSPGRHSIVTVTTMAAMLMVVLDTTIANVALPHMQAAIGATGETVTWVLTSYIVGSAIAMPLTGWLADRIGRRWLFAIAVGGFTLTSALCGVAGTLTAMVLARLAQGVFGAFLVPLSQAVMYDINPPHKHARAMTIWGIVVMVGPIMGPVLGGYLTESFNWRWVFFVNVPIGVVTTFIIWFSLPDSPLQRRPFDILGFLSLGAALAAFQLLLDRGAQLDWFHSTEIVIEAAVAIGALWIFVVHTMTARHGLLPRAVFRDRNLVAALVFVTVASGISIGGAALIAPMLQRLLGYPVMEAGLLVAPRGIGTMVGMILAGRLIRYVDGRLVIMGGTLVMAWSLHLMTGFDLLMGKEPVIWTGLIQGFGLGLTLLPMNLLAFATLPTVLRTDGASLYSLLRSIGGSISIAIATALLARNTQVSHADLGAHVTNTGQSMSGMFEEFGVRVETVAVMIDAEINRQALMIAYLDDYWLMMWAVLLTAPLAMLMRKARSGSAPVAIGE